MSVTIIGDVHGYYHKYLKIIKKCEYSIQLGDFGFSYDDIINNCDPNKHKLIPGNHDNYDKLTNHHLTSFGNEKLNNLDFFYIRGAYSIDRKYRVLGNSYWENEELSWSEGQKCVELFKSTKPSIVLSHDLPLICHTNGLVSSIYIPSLTTQILQSCFEAHKPKLWIGGHYHRSWKKQIDNTLFVCLNELETMVIPQ